MRTLMTAIAEAQTRRGAAEAEIARLRQEGQVEMPAAEAAFSELENAKQDLACLQDAYEDLGGDPDASFS